MKKSFLSLAAIVLGVSSASAQNFTLTSSSEETILVNHELVAPSILSAHTQFTTIGTTNYIDFSKSHKIVSSELGAPTLPFYTESIVIPGEGAIALEVSYDSYTDYENILITPSKGDLKRNVLPSSVPYTFGEEYNTNAFYPGALATITDPFILRNTRGITIVVNPYQYNPVTKTLRVYSNIQAKVVINSSEIGINEMEAKAENTSVYANIYANFYLNASSALGRYAPREEEGDMLIIADDAFLDEMAAFVEWKTQSGIKTTITGMSDVGSSDTDVKTYIENFYSANPDLVYVLLVGDHADVPSHTYGISGSEQLWSDSYYGQMTSDFYPELFVGRFSGNAANITTMVTRTLEYEKDPAAGDWMSRAIGLASNEGSGIGDDGEADWQHARNMRTKLLAYGYSEVFEFYDGSHGGADAPGNPNSTIILPEVNTGVGLFNYTGHGAIDVCVTGNFSSSHINSATNNGKYPFVISVACNNGSFTSGTCISETWMNATNAGSPSGAIAACGSSILMAWAQPMQTQDEMTEIIAENYASNRKETLGGLFYNSQMSMLETYGASTTAKEVMQTWVMFGDPSTIFRNQETMDMTVSHVPTVALGATSVNVACDVEDANIAISQDGILLGEGKVVSGSAAITFDAISSTSPLTVVATKQNYRPYIGEITVINSAGFDEINANTISVYPNPANEMVTVSWNQTDSPVAITLFDLSGKVLFSTSVNNGTNQSIETAVYAAGVYMLSVKIGENTSLSKLVIR